MNHDSMDVTGRPEIDQMHMISAQWLQALYKCDGQPVSDEQLRTLRAGALMLYLAGIPQELYPEYEGQRMISLEDVMKVVASDWDELQQILAHGAEQNSKASTDQQGPAR